MAESEYIRKEAEEHPETVYLADLRILRRYVQNGSFGYREIDDVVFQRLKTRATQKPTARSARSVGERS